MQPDVEFLKRNIITTAGTENKNSDFSAIEVRTTKHAV